MNKRGNLLWGITIAIISLALATLILYFTYGSFPFYSAIDKDACSQSVKLRDAAKVGPFDLGAKTIPLNCKTEKICLSLDGEECKDLPKPSFNNPITEEKLGKSDPKTESMDKIAEAMYDCHTMLGQGLYNFVPTSWTVDENYCLICSRIVFDEEAKQQNFDITYGELYRFLQQKKNKEKQTYLSYIYGWSDWSTSKTLFENVKAKNPNNPNIPASFEDWKISPSKSGGYVIIAQMANKGRIGQLAGGTAVLGGVLFTGPLGWLSGALVLGGSAVTYISTPTKDVYYSPPTIMPYNVETLRALDCTSFETAP